MYATGLPLPSGPLFQWTKPWEIPASVPGNFFSNCSGDKLSTISKFNMDCTCLASGPV